jgi:hypothetical protein
MQTPAMKAARVKPTTRPIMRLVWAAELERRCIKENVFLIESIDVEMVEMVGT